MTDLELQSHSTPPELFQAPAIFAMLAITSFIIHDLGHVLFSSADQHINPAHNWHAADYRHSISMRLPEDEPLIGRQPKMGICRC
jgi:hypothetical protein